MLLCDFTRFFMPNMLNNTLEVIIKSTNESKNIQKTSRSFIFESYAENERLICISYTYYAEIRCRLIEIELLQ